MRLFHSPPAEEMAWDNDFDLMTAIVETQQAEIEANCTTTTSVSKQVVKRSNNSVPNISITAKSKGTLLLTSRSEVLLNGHLFNQRYKMNYLS